MVALLARNRHTVLINCLVDSLHVLPLWGAYLPRGSSLVERFLYELVVLGLELVAKAPSRRMFVSSSYTPLGRGVSTLSGLKPYPAHSHPAAQAHMCMPIRMVPAYRLGRFFEDFFFTDLKRFLRIGSVLQ